MHPKGSALVVCFQASCCFCVGRALCLGLRKVWNCWRWMWWILRMRLGDIITPKWVVFKDFDFSQGKERDSTQLTPEDSNLTLNNCVYHGVFSVDWAIHTSLAKLATLENHAWEWHGSQQLITKDSTVYVYNKYVFFNDGKYTILKVDGGFHSQKFKRSPLGKGPW